MRPSPLTHPSRRPPMRGIALLLGPLWAGCIDFSLYGRDSMRNAPGQSGSSGGSCDCPSGYDPLPDGSSCVKEERAPATFQGEGAEVCAIEPYIEYSRYGAIWPGGTNEQDEWWGENDAVADGRLNEVGVWACGMADQPEHPPVGEWIGFSVCLDLEEEGLYLVGLGADNRMRLLVDGDPYYVDADDNTENFIYWWIQALPLSAGRHILELEGFNAGAIAGFGAEIAGPFQTDGALDDAALRALDYPGNIVWSTADVVGSTFVLGERSGWFCPDGSALDTCGGDPECVTLSTTDCI